MALLLNCEAISKTYGARPLFQNVTLAIDERDHIGLIGPNGSGKSTLLKILAGLEHADTGDFTMRKGMRVGYVRQTDSFSDDATPLSAVVEAMGREGAGRVAGAAADAEEIHARETRAYIELGKVGFTDFEKPVELLSGGWRKRLAIACELACDADLLLLDEPTNHLDLEGILWLEEMLEQSNIAFVVVTHDRYFLENVSNRVVELNAAFPEGTFEAKGSYSTFLERRADFLDAQASQQQALAGKVRVDNAWLSRGAKARRTKNKGRIQDAAVRRDQLAQLAQRNAAPATAGIDFKATGRRTQQLLMGKGLTKSLGGKQLFEDLEIVLSPGAIVGLLGPNGSGKTTLIRVLTGDLEPDAGSIKRADNLRIVSLSQRRTELNRTISLREALCPIGDTIFHNDKAIHVSSWAKRFLFRTDQLKVPVGDLSGGEQARIIIADLMHQPADMLVLDEPTNDLDIPSLEVLEQSLREFPGAVLLVTHDRAMLDRLATQIVGLDGEGNARHFASYAQWQDAEDQRLAAAEQSARAGSKPAAKPAAQNASTPAPSAPAKKKGKLNFNEQREWDQMEQKIHDAEAKLEKLQAQMDDPKLMADHAKMAKHCEVMGQVQQEVEALYERWAELEEKQA